MPIPNPSLPSVPDGLHVADLTLDAAGLLITARTTAAQVACPACGQSSPRVHSAYWRSLTDLPWQEPGWHVAREGATLILAKRLLTRPLCSTHGRGIGCALGL